MPESSRVYDPKECGWALEFKVAATLGKTGMWQCVLGRESLMIYGVSQTAKAFFDEFLRGIPPFLEVPDLPGDRDRDSSLNLNIGPFNKQFFVMTSADRYDLFSSDHAKSVKALREKAEDLVDYVYGYLRPGRFMPVAGPAAVWRIIMSA